MRLSELKKTSYTMNDNHLEDCHTYPIRHTLTWILQFEIRPLSFAKTLQAIHGDKLIPLPSL